MKILSSSRLIFGIFIVSSMIFIILGYKHILDTWPSFVSFFLFWITTFVKMLYDSWDRFYFVVNRIKANILNTATTWEISAEYSLVRSGLLDGITASIKKAFPSLKFRENTNSHKIIHTDKLTLFLKESSEADADFVGEGGITSSIIETGKVTIPYRQIENMLEREIIPLFNKIEHEIIPEHCKYTLRINYDENNPFFGLYVRRLPAGAISSFKCDIMEKLAGESIFITIEAKKVIIIASSASDLSSVSRKYLLMATFR
jgi:hypothetical protein